MRTHVKRDYKGKFRHLFPWFILTDDFIILVVDKRIFHCNPAKQMSSDWRGCVGTEGVPIRSDIQEWVDVRCTHELTTVHEHGIENRGIWTVL